MQVSAKTEFTVVLSQQERRQLVAIVWQWLEAHPQGYVLEGPEGTHPFAKQLHEDLDEVYTGLRVATLK